MTFIDLIVHGLRHYWRTNLAVVLGVAVAVGVLAGALLVGDSVRGSLRSLVLERLGNTDDVIVSSHFVREELAANLAANPEFSQYFEKIAPMILAQGFVTNQVGGGRAGQVRVYGVDDRFWAFHGVNGVSGPSNRDALISPALAEDIGAVAGTTVLARVQRPSDVPLESLHGEKDDLGQTIRVTVHSILPRESMGEFALDPQQGEIRAVFVPLVLLQREMGAPGRINAMLAARQSAPEAPLETPDPTAALERAIRDEADLVDLGLRVRVLEIPGTLALESDAGLLDASIAAAARDASATLGLEGRPLLTYLANTLRRGDREIPYSLVTAIDLPATAAPSDGVPPIVLNEWAAEDLNASIGDRVSMEFYVWEEPGRLASRTAEFQISGVVPVATGDRAMAPVYPGITEAATLGDWDPPFPIDLRRIRPQDEAWWDDYRATPKAFVSLETGQTLWTSRYGSMTSIRFDIAPDRVFEDVRSGLAEQLRSRIDPLAAGFAIAPVRVQSLEASGGATDFGEYFVYFSVFLVVSALLLAALFFKLSVEQRVREVGLLRAVGFQEKHVRRLFLGEGLLLSMAGAAIGIIGAVGYAWLIVFGLRTWWVDAVGSTALSLHLSVTSLAAGAIGGMVAAVMCIAMTLRSLARISERSLLAGQLTRDAMAQPGQGGNAVTTWGGSLAFAVIGVGLIAGAAVGYIDDAAAFFGAGAALLAACLLFFMYWMGRPSKKTLDARRRWPIPRLGMRNAAYRPSRSVLLIATIGAATFILISVDAFRREGGSMRTDRESGVGGYTLMVDLLLPVVQDPASPEGLELLGLSQFESTAAEPFRVRPGDDASCLNLYEPKNPRIIAPPESFIREGRFAFRDVLDANDSEETNPWELLHRTFEDGAIPVIADANSMAYVLHRGLGEDIVLTHGNGTLRLRLVAALDDSIFQGELLMSEENFISLFPEQEGYRFLLVETAPDQAAVVAATMEDALGDYGADVTLAVDRLAEFHRVENTYLSTFQMLGGLGLLLGTVGLGAVLLRSVLERRRELALLRALGYRNPHLFAMVAAENLALLACGLATGAVCAVLAIAPALSERAGRLPDLDLVILLGGVFAAGVVTSLVATWAALREDVLSALRSE